MSLPVRADNAGLFVSRGIGAHPDRTLTSHELIYVREGTLFIRECERSFQVTRGQSLLLFPDRRHVGTAAYGADLSFYWLHFTLRRGARAADALPVAVPQHAAVARPDHLSSLLHRFLDDQESGALLALEADLLVVQMLLEVARSQPSEQVSPIGGARFASRAEIMIRQRFHEDLSVSIIARALACNPDYLGRVFRQFYGHTVTEALLRQRVRHAKRLLLDSSDRIEQIAASCGFHEPGYFRRIFRRYEGVPPSRYRRLHARQHVITI